MFNVAVLNWLDPFAHSPGRTGGAELQLAEIVRRFAAWGHRVTVFAAPPPGHSGSQPPAGVEVVHAGTWHTANWQVRRALRQQARRQRFDVVLEDINKVPFFAPGVVDCPVVALIPHLFRRHVYRDNPLPVGLYVNFMERLIPHCYRTARFIAVSESTRADLIDLGVAATRVKVVHNGLDHQRYQAVERRPAATPLLVHAGRLKRYKCIDHLIRAFVTVRKRVPEARLVLMGDGSDRPRLERLANQLGLETSVRFLGHVSEAEKVRWLREGWVFVNPSSKEGWGLNNLEANACGMPVVAYDSYGLRDSVSPGLSGQLVPFGRIELLAEVLVTLLTDTAQRQRLGEGAVRWAQRFTWDRCAAETLAVLEAAVAEGRSG